VRVELNGIVIASSHQALRVLETTHPPTIYVPRADLQGERFRPAYDDRRTVCEWKGRASYLDVLANGSVSERAAWFYADPVSDYAALRDHIAIYAGRVSACYLDDERVAPQPGDFYGGWITADIQISR
jgi:uncharacterized protein (DUF427 family)